MERPEILQRFLDLFEQPNYLEIGVDNGFTFHAVKAARRVGVDPQFNFDFQAARSINPDATYHQVTSDNYFSNIIRADERFDLIFIDGLHEFEQTLRDLLNAIEHLKPGGVIVVDDVIPTSYAAALPTHQLNMVFRAARGITDDSWMGDVYRLVYFIRDYLRHWTYATTTEMHGLAVLWRSPRLISEAPLGMNAIMQRDYSAVVLDAEVFNQRSISEILADVRNSLAARG